MLSPAVIGGGSHICNHCENIIFRRLQRGVVGAIHESPVSLLSSPKTGQALIENFK